RKQQLCTIVVLSLLPCRRAQDTFEDPHKPPPSAVVHVRGLSDTALESDLVEAVRHFGLVSFVVMIPKTRQALVEFEDPESSRSCVDYSSKGSVYVCGQPAYFNFSTSQKLWRPGVPGDNGNSNHILLFTILNPIYPITTDVLYNICKPFGPLQRIVIFRKNGLQAFVEFVSVESAERANSSLNGADIYSGCCTLIVDYARATRLNVFKNDSETWDFTNPGLKQGKTNIEHIRAALSRQLVVEHLRALPHTEAHGGNLQATHEQSSARQPTATDVNGDDTNGDIGDILVGTWEAPGTKQPTRRRRCDTHGRPAPPHACSATSRNTRRSTPRPLHRNRHVPLGRGHRITRVQPQAPGDTALTDRQSTGTTAKKPGATKARIHRERDLEISRTERVPMRLGLKIAPLVRIYLDAQDNAVMPAKQTSLLGDHPKAHACGGGDCGGHQQPPPPGVDYGSGGDGMGGGGGMGMGVGMGNQVGPQGGTQGQHVQAMMNQQADNKVLIVYDLDAERFNCDRVFNILCLFGDVEKVKFLKSKPGAAMVEMGDQYAVHRAVFHLNMSQIFGNKINLCVSRQRSIVPGQAFELLDGTDSYRDYAGSHNYRYANSEKAAKNRNQRPTAVLHFFNAPTDITAEMFAQLCDEMSIARPRSFKVFSGKTDRSVSGLTEWETKNDAMEALACINHHPLKNANVPYLYTLKLCFSTAQPS
uniref:Heterogeneous nuclear ribonucleoprotein L-like n=1 Tax=Petromyzon marinus TaxID=7757 RepID=A0AAJ7SK93_PETMA